LTCDKKLKSNQKTISAVDSDVIRCVLSTGELTAIKNYEKMPYYYNHTLLISGDLTCV